MANEEKIVNKIIPVETIIKVANYMEDLKEEYQKMMENDKQINSRIKYSEQVYEYKEGSRPKVEYMIEFKDGKEVKEEGYNWFIGNLNNLNLIKRIKIYLFTSYSSNMIEKEHYEYMRLHVWAIFYEDSVSVKVEGKNIEEKIYKIHSELKGIIENNDERYNKTIKNRNLRMQSFCLSIGFILSYIIYFIIIANKSKIPDGFIKILNNKMAIVIGQWIISAITGNIFGFPVMLSLYRNIVPKTKYSHIDKSSRKAVYVDNIDDYISHDEVQIGKFANNITNREKIEKIYKITSKIVLAQAVISVLLLVLLK